MSRMMSRHEPGQSAPAAFAAVRANPLHGLFGERIASSAGARGARTIPPQRAA